MIAVVHFEVRTHLTKRTEEKIKTSSKYEPSLVEVYTSADIHLSLKSSLIQFNKFVSI